MRLSAKVRVRLVVIWLKTAAIARTSLALLLLALGLLLVAVFMSDQPLFGLEEARWEIIRLGLSLCFSVVMAVFAVVFLLLMTPRIATETRVTASGWAGLVAVILLLVTSGYASLYLRIGLVGPNPSINPTFVDAFYFSVVTLTTLGYGDFRPSPSARLLAASEALFGYFFLALFIAAAVERLREYGQRELEDDDTA